MFRRILVGFDGSRDAREALRTGIAMASAAKGEVAVLIVVSASHGETDEDRRAAFEAESAPLRASAEHELQRRSEATPPAPPTSSPVIVRPTCSLPTSRSGGSISWSWAATAENAPPTAGSDESHGTSPRRARCPLLLVGDGNPDGE